MNFRVADLLGIAFVAFVAVGVLWLPTHQACRLLERSLERVAVKGVIVQGLRPHNPVVSGGGDHGDLAAKFVFLVRFAMMRESIRNAVGTDIFLIDYTH